MRHKEDISRRKSLDFTCNCSKTGPPTFFSFPIASEMDTHKMETKYALVLLTLFAHTGSSGKSANDKRKPIENYKLSAENYTDSEPHHEKLERHVHSLPDSPL